MPDFDWFAKQSPQDAVAYRPDPAKVADEMYRDVRASAKRSRLTWTQQDHKEWMDAGRIGEFRPRLPYSLINRRYIVQLGPGWEILERNGHPITVEDIPDPEDRRRVAEALAVFRVKALEADPHLCKFCVQFRSTEYADHLKHLAAAHREEFDRMLAGPGTATAVAQPEPKVDGLRCTFCDRTFTHVVAHREHTKTHQRHAPSGE